MQPHQPETGKAPSSEPALRTFGGAPARVVIAGGGVAGLEAMLALRALARERVQMDLIAPSREFVYRPLSVLEPFDGETPRFDLSKITHDNGITHHLDAVAEVDTERHRIRTRGRKDIRYDALVLASGTRPKEAIPGALTFGADVSGESFAALVYELEHGLVRHIVFALPGGVAWSLPLYELALNAAARMRASDVSGVELTIVTPEDAPLRLFGKKASDEVRERLDEAGIHLMTATHPSAADLNGLTIVPKGHIEADRVVALPRLEGLAPAGIPHDDAGFVLIDEHGQVEGVSDVYAAGDVTTFPVKQGGVAAAQADVVAEAIAARVGAPVTPSAFRPVLRGILIGGDGDVYLSAHITRGPAIDSPAGAEPQWWPPPKISARYLAPYLAEHRGELQISERPQDATALR